MEGKKGIIIIIILGFVILGLGGFIIYDKFIKEEEEDINSTTTIGKVNVDLNVLYQVGDTLEHFDKAFNDPASSYFGYIYQKKLKAEKFDRGAALFASVSKNLIRSNTLQTISEVKIKEDFQKIFGKNLTYEAAQMNAGAAYNFVYDGTTQVYNYIVPVENSIYEPRYLVRNVKTVVTEDSVVVTRKIFYVEYSGDGQTVMSKASIYKDASKQKKFGEVKLKDGVVNTKEVISKYGSKLNTYEVTFKQNKEDDYSFYQIKKKK